jgi:hypothetical protein
VQHALEQPALHRIVVDNEDAHKVSGGLVLRTLCRFGALCGRRLKSVLS